MRKQIKVIEKNKELIKILKVNMLLVP